MSEELFPPGTFRPDPGRGSLGRMLGAQTLTETKLALRNGEQVLLTLLIPVILLVGLTLIPVFSLPEPRVDHIAPRILALAVMSSAFTGQAIALGFDRRYGVLRRLAATALPRWSIVAGRLLSSVAIVLVQMVLLSVVAVALGWSPRAAGIPVAVLLVVLGTLAFGALGILLGGALRAEIVLALANLVWLVLLLASGFAATTSGIFRTLVEFLPSGALSEALHSALNGAAPGWQPVLVLLVWGLLAGGLATRTTKLV